MQYTVTEYKRCMVFKTKERIDHFSAPEFEQITRKLIEDGHYKLVFDLSEVDFISSAGWWALINCQKSCKRFNRGEVVLVGLQPRIRESMDIVGISQYFRQYDDAISAVGSF